MAVWKPLERKGLKTSRFTAKGWYKPRIKGNHIVTSAHNKPQGIRKPAGPKPIKPIAVTMPVCSECVTAKADKQPSDS